MNFSALKSTHGKLFSSFVIIALLAGGFYGLGALTSPQNVNQCPSGYQFIPNSALNSGVGACARLTVVIDHQEQTTVNPELLAEGFTADCVRNCHGIIYTLDPTVLITNGGHDFEQCKTFGTAGTITCTSADSATIIGLSESTSTPLTGDYSAVGPCKTTSPGGDEISSGGLAAIAGTATPGAQSSTVTTTVTHTFTAAETDSAVQVACLQTELSSGANPVIYAEGTFGPDSLTSGNVISVTWSIARS